MPRPFPVRTAINAARPHLPLAALLLVLPLALSQARAAEPPLSDPPLAETPVSQPGRATLAPRERGRAAARSLSIEAGMGRVVRLAAAAATVFAADPKVVEVRPASPTSLFVFGVGPGRTTIAALNAAGGIVAEYTVMVTPSGYGAAGAQAAIAQALPGRPVHVETTGNGLALTGSVTTASEAERAATAARGYLAPHQTLDNRLAIAGAVQVNLRVRIAEMGRSLTRSLGLNWNNLGGQLGHWGAIGLATAPYTGTAFGALSAVGAGPGGFDLNGVIDALAQDQLVHMLAEPNLTAMSGETASFLVGGEFPVPVGQEAGAISIDFKQYGVSLAFVPTVFDHDRISLKVRPEVSELSTQGAVTLSAGNSSISVPALTTRRAETTVELGSGQSFAIAGLLQDSTTLAATGIPFLGDIPILGALFRSDSFQRNETELVIVVTPYIVRPVSDPARLAAPTDGWRPPNDLERILLLRQTGRTPSGSPVATEAATRIPGDAGFVIQ